MTDTSFSYLDSYCERAGDPSLWAEPVNFLTNIAFLIAAFITFKNWQNSKHLTLKNSWDILLLIAVLAIIGIGSGLWHFHATPATLLADVIPITLFINIYLIIFLIRVAGAKAWLVALIWIGFQGLNIFSEMFFDRDTLNGTIMYAPTYLVYFGLVMFSIMRFGLGIPAKLMLISFIVWTFSLISRTIDLEMCEFLYYGTHFLWHILNAVTLYLLLRVLIPAKT